MQVQVRAASRLLLFLAGLTLPLGCGPDSHAAVDGALAGKLTVTGSSTVAPLVLAISKRFEAEHPGVRIDVQTGGSGRGIADATSGLADIGMASRALEESESEALVHHAIARDGVCLIVHADNPIATLPDETVRAIYRGEVERWDDLGGPDKAITVVNKASGRATLELFLGYFDLEEPEIRADVVIGDNEQGIKTVSIDPGAIGYVSIGAAEHAARSGVPIRLMPVNGVAPSSDSVASGEYPISRPLLLLTDGLPSMLEDEFIAFCRSTDVHDLVDGLHFVPVVD